TELLSAVERIERHFGAVNIKRHLAGMDLQSKTNAGVLANIENGLPSLRELPQSLTDFLPIVLWITLYAGPQRRAAKSCDHSHAELLSSADGRCHLLGGALLNAARVAVAPDIVR